MRRHIPDQKSMMHEELPDPSCSIYEAANGYIMNVVRPNPEFKKLLLKARNSPPGAPLAMNLERVDDPSQIQQAIGLAMVKGFPPPIIEENYVFKSWSDLVSFLSNNPMGEPIPFQDDNHDRGNQEDS